MPRPFVVVLVAVILAPPGALLGQSRVSQLVDSARVQLAANHLDSAEALLRAALDTTAPAAPADRNNALVWDAIVQFLRGHEDLARAAFRQALALDPSLEVNGLDHLSPELAQQFQQEKQAVGRRHGFYVSKDVDESPRRLSGPPVDYPRSLLRRHVQGFVQLAALALALDTALTRPTEGERVYALLVRGVAASRTGRDSAGRADLAAGLALYQTLTTRGVDLAPFLRRFADSLRLGQHGAKPPGAAMSAPIAVGAVDEQPVLVSHPPIRYPPEMQSLRVDGTVLVEAALDVTGHVEPGSAKIVQSPNHAFDEEALRVVRGSAYRPARSKGRAVRAVIQQPISFVNY